MCEGSPATYGVISMSKLEHLFLVHSIKTIGLSLPCVPETSALILTRIIRHNHAPTCMCMRLQVVKSHVHMPSVRAGGVVMCFVFVQL